MIKRNILSGAVMGAAMSVLAATASFAQQGGLGAERLLDVIVVMDEASAPGGHGANRAAAAAFARGLGVNPRHAYGTALFGFAASVPQAVMDALENNPRVDYVELDRTAFASAPKRCSNDPTLPGCGGGGGGEDPAPPSEQITPWGIESTGGALADGAGLGIDVYVLDTGIDLDHPDLQPIASARDCTGGTCVDDPGEADDKNGHGTHVAGTIGARDNDFGVVGMAPGVNLHAVQVLGNSGRGSFSGIIAGIDWVTAEVNSAGEPAVINMSLGGSGSKDNTCTINSFEGTGDSFHAAICNAKNAGVVIVVAAGNSGVDAESSVPAAYDDAVITVSATDINDNFPSFSNWGNNAATWSDVDSEPVAISAPGVNILSTWKGGGIKEISGTSMASPHVAGAVALFLQANPQVAADHTAFSAARDALLKSGDSTSGFGGNTASRPHLEPFLDATFAP